MKKTERLLAIVLSLKKRGKMTASQLSESLEVNIRTIYRDIDALSQMGVPLISHPGKEGGYEIMEGYFLPSVSFTKDEVLALSIARDLILNTDIPGFDPFIRSAFLKIENITPGEEAERIGKLTDRILFDLKYIDPPEMDKGDFQIIRKALEENRCLTIDYYSTRRAVVDRKEVRPWILFFTDGVWYLRGESDDRPFLWWFRLDRIRSVQLLDDRFSLPEGFDKNQLAFSGNVKGDLAVKISIDPSLYEVVKEDVIFQDSVIEDAGDTLNLSFSTGKKEYILEFLFRNFEKVQLLEPPSLVAELRERIKILSSMY